MPTRVCNQDVTPAVPLVSCRAAGEEPSVPRPPRSAHPTPREVQQAVVAIPADILRPVGVAEGSVVDDPCKVALSVVNEQLKRFTNFRVQSRRFVVQDKLGEGQSCVVFHVEDCAEDYYEDRHVALKMVPLTGAYIAETYATAALLKRLSHEFIVPCHEFFEYDTGGASFLCLKLTLCHARSLAGVMRWKNLSGGKVNPEKIVAYISQLASALQYLHNQGLLHGDLRPDHVLLHQYREEVQLIGLTECVGFRRRSANAASVTGGRLLSAPPEWANSPFLGRRLHPQEVPLPSYDMWTLGCLLVELCTNRSLEDRLGPRGTPLASNPSAMQAVLQEMHLVHKGLFEPLARGLLDPDPDTRFDPEEVQEALKEVKPKLGSFTDKFSKPFKLFKSKA